MDDQDKIQEDECMNQYCTIESQNVYPAKFSDQILFFCKECLELYTEKKCCYFCAQVYSDQNENFLDGQKWIACDQEKCDKWTHLSCEAKNGIHSIECLVEDMKFKYVCPWCRIEDQKQRNMKPLPRSINRKGFKFLEKIHKRKNSTYEPPLNNNNNGPSYFGSTYTSKSSYLDELLKKNGGFSQQITQEEMQLDLQKMISLVKQ
ncbi:unnamed protein product [Paramecium octaurelia]|uniref:PHD-type domain-containing protein n=1 Tax=Paramecium octaurelia TaxID=43137 RepID=A0A8S1SHU5_PAROT|nr:unnamed protein product [Paramecium octaurelia]